MLFEIYYSGNHKKGTVNSQLDSGLKWKVVKL